MPRHEYEITAMEHVIREHPHHADPVTWRTEDDRRASVMELLDAYRDLQYKAEARGLPDMALRINLARTIAADAELVGRAEWLAAQVAV